MNTMAAASIIIRGNKDEKFVAREIAGRKSLQASKIHDREIHDREMKVFISVVI